MHALNDIQPRKHAATTGDVLDLTQPGLITDQLRDDTFEPLEALPGKPGRRCLAEHTGNGRSQTNASSAQHLVMSAAPGLDEEIVFCGLVAVENQLSSEPAANAITCSLELALRRQ